MKKMVVLAVSILFSGSAFAAGPKGGDTRIDDQRSENRVAMSEYQDQAKLSEGHEGFLTRNRGDKDRPVPNAKMKRQRNAGTALLSSNSDYTKVGRIRGDKDRPIPHSKDRGRASR